MSNIYKEEIDKKELYLPLSIDEYISENNQVRAVEDFVEMLDMVELGFANSDLKATDGQPAYHPKLLSLVPQLQLWNAYWSSNSP